MPKKIDPSKATPQAPRNLRVGSKGSARALAAKAAGEPPPAPKADEDSDEDEDEEDDDEHDQEAHDAACSAASEKMRGAADAYDAAKGSDSASALMAAEDAGDDAAAAHEVGKASCMKMRGAEARDEPPKPGAPPPPAAGAARALTALAGPGATAQLELAQLAGGMRDVLALTATATVGAALVKLEGWKLGAAEVARVRASEKSRAAATLAQAFHDRLSAACLAGMDRAKAFNVTMVASKEVLTPKASWTRGTLADLDEALADNGYPSDKPAARATLIHASPDGGGEAGLAARAHANGVPVDIQRAAEANRSTDR